MISAGNRKDYATHSERHTPKMLGLSKGKIVTRMDVRQAVPGVTNRNSIRFWASQLNLGKHLAR
jgi:hypothetical protein